MTIRLPIGTMMHLKCAAPAPNPRLLRILKTAHAAVPDSREPRGVAL
jgi:hypothetical protein